MKRKVVYNRCYGGFSLSREAVLLGRKLSENPLWGGPCIKGDTYEDGTVCTSDYGHIDDIPRHDPILVAVVEKLDKQSNGMCAKLQIKEVHGPYRIEEYDGMETVMCPGDYDFIE